MNHNGHTRRTWDEYCPHWTISTDHLPRWYFVFPFYYYNEIPGQLIVKRKDLFGFRSVIAGSMSWQKWMAIKLLMVTKGKNMRRILCLKIFELLLGDGSLKDPLPSGSATWETKAFVTKTWECGLGCLITKLWHHCRTFWVPWRIIWKRVLHK